MCLEKEAKFSFMLLTMEIAHYLKVTFRSVAEVNWIFNQCMYWDILSIIWSGNLKDLKKQLPPKA